MNDAIQMLLTLFRKRSLATPLGKLPLVFDRVGKARPDPLVLDLLRTLVFLLDHLRAVELENNSLSGSDNVIRTRELVLIDQLTTDPPASFQDERLLRKNWKLQSGQEGQGGDEKNGWCARYQSRSKWKDRQSLLLYEPSDPCSNEFAASRSVRCDRDDRTAPPSMASVQFPRIWGFLPTQKRLNRF